MPILDRLALAAACIAAACASNPDPRSRSVAKVERDGHGGWIVVELASHARLEGELIAVDSGAVRVLTRAGLVSVGQREVATAELWAWGPEIGGTLAWGVAGTASTISHGYFLVLSAPLWILTSSVVSAIESRVPRIEYPAHGWDAISRWARFPQGLPPGVYSGDLVRQNRAPPAAPASPAASPASPAAPPASPAAPPASPAAPPASSAPSAAPAPPAPAPGS